MKVIATTLALLSTIGLRADLTPPPPHPVWPVISSGPAAAPEQVNETVDQALHKAGEITAQVMDQAANALDFAKGKMAMAAGEDGPEIMNLFRTDSEGGLGEFLFAPGRSASQPLIIRTGEVDPASIADLQEDLTVMSRIVAKTVEREVGRENHEAAMGIVLSALPGGRRPQSLYLDGYGAVFLVNVRFPLIPTPVKEEEKSDKPADTTWEKTKQELYGPKQPSGRSWSPPLPGDAQAEYNADQVDSLKKELTDSLKNAANIRSLKPDESITIAVIGSRGSGGATRVSHVPKNNTRRADVVYANGPSHAGRETTLTIRAKKADIDAFAKGALDSEAFRKRVVVAAY